MSRQEDADVSASGFSSGQRRVVLLMGLIIVVVFALLAGYFVTSLQNLQPAPIVTLSTPAATSSPSASPSPPPATPTPVPEDSIWSQVRAARLFDQIAHQAETERALSPEAEVPLSFLDEDEIRETLESLYREDERQAAALPFTVLGLLPEGLSDIEAQSPTGIYVAEQQQLYVAINGGENDPKAQTVLAHAYVHALQDQHFDLKAMDVRAGTTDEKLAVQALIEGDATLATALYGSDDLSSVDWEQLKELIIEAEQPDYGEPLASSEAWAKLQRFPYESGLAFAMAVFQHGGWDAVNNCYANPPYSTAQILHPSRYLSLDSPGVADDAGRTVIVPDLEPVLGEGWSLSRNDTLGELTAGLLLSQAMPAERAWGIADGWEGDTFVVWAHEDGRQTIIWRTVWKTSSKAAAFEDGLTLLIPQLHVPVRPMAAPRGLPGQWWEGASTVNVRRAARHVLLVRGPDANTTINALQGLP